MQKMDIYMAAAAFLAYVIKGMCGFANTLVFGTVMSFRADNIDISPTELILGYPSNVIIAYKERKSLSVKVWLPLSCLVIAGAVPGVFFLKNGDTSLVKIFFGFVVVFIGGEMLWRDHGSRKQKTSPVVLGLIGLLSGLLCGLFGIGALLAAYIGRTTDNNQAFRGNLCIVFLIENTFRILLYSLSGILTIAVWIQAFKMMPVMLVGLLCGMLLSKRVPEKAVRRSVIILLIASGAALIINNLNIN